MNGWLLSYLEIKVHTLSEIGLLGKTFIFAHIKAQRIIAIGRLTFRQKHGIVESKTVATGHFLQN